MCQPHKLAAELWDANQQDAAWTYSVRALAILVPQANTKKVNKIYNMQIGHRYRSLEVQVKM